jgi:GYF domain 2
MQNYFYRDNSGKEIGPLHLDTLVRLRLAGALNDNTLARPEDSTEWKSLRELLPSSPAPQTPQKSSKQSINWTWAGLLLAAAIIMIALHFNNSPKDLNDTSRNSSVATFEKALVQTQPSPPASQNSAEESRIECVTNLKEIALAFTMWAGYNGNQYPFNVRIASGGTMEYCDRTSDGFDKNAYLHFQVMSNELSTTKILVCPSDSKKPAIDFAHLRPENVSYQIHSGINIDESNPHEVLAICPIHRVAVLTDGSVMQLSIQQMSEMEANIRAAEAILQGNACINNLRQIDGAISEWALETGKSVGTIPTMADIKPYIRLNANGEVPSCPSGGKYTLHPVGSNPQVTCSIPGHVLP